MLLEHEHYYGSAGNRLLYKHKCYMECFCDNMFLEHQNFVLGTNALVTVYSQEQVITAEG